MCTPVLRSGRDREASYLCLFVLWRPNSYLKAGGLPVYWSVWFSECSLPTSGVYVSTSADMEIVGGVAVRWLVVNWFGMDVTEGDLVQLVDTEAQTILATVEVTDPEGWFTSDVAWDGSLFPNSLDNVSEIYLPYKANYVRNEITLHSATLTLRPRWMELQRLDLWNASLTKVALPGTHDAGASTHNGAMAENIVGRWAFTQDETLWQQLVLGARYMDMRIGYYENREEKFYVHHGEVVIAPLQGYLDDVVKFMSQTQEIVIFDIHDLNNGFDGHPERHAELISILESNFGEWMASNTLEPNPTMGELWREGARLIVTYPSQENANSDYLWGSVYHLWGDANTLDDLEAFLYTGIPQQVNRGSLWSAMAELTPSATDVVVNKWGGLRGAANITNFPVTNWFRRDWWDQVNIVSMDFLAHSDVVSVAVEANRVRQQCRGGRKAVSASGRSTPRRR